MRQPRGAIPRYAPSFISHYLLWVNSTTNSTFGSVEKGLSYLVPAQIKLDQLRILQTFANVELPPPTDLNKGEMTTSADGAKSVSCRAGIKESSGLEFQADGPLSFYFFFTGDPKVQRYPVSAVQGIFDNGGLRHTILPYAQRIQQYMREVQKSWETTALIGGAFRVNSERGMVALARIKYEPEPHADGNRYTIMSKVDPVADSPMVT